MATLKAPEASVTPEGTRYRVYQDARGKWIVQNKWTDAVVGYKFATKWEAISHSNRLEGTIPKAKVQQPKIKCANCGYKFVLLYSSKQCPLCGNELGNKVQE